MGLITIQLGQEISQEIIFDGNPGQQMKLWLKLDFDSINDHESI